MTRALGLLFVVLFQGQAHALTVVMQPWSGSDGPYTDVVMDGNTIHQANDGGGGNYAGFQYYRRPSGVNFTVGATLYLEVDFKDIGGPGRIGAQYNAVGNDFLSAGMVLGTSVQNTGAYKTGVMRLDANNFHLGQNGGNDLRLTRTQNLRFHIKEVRVSDTPTAAYLAATAYMGPYTGPTYVGGTPVDASSFTGKMYVGYQGWFRTPNDDDDVGWQHWTRSWGNMAAGLISEDFWPQMDELTAAEKHAATGYTYSNGAQAELFSSDNARTVLRHFQWMEAYGIDGAAVQRFTNGLASPGSDSYRVISHVRAAANQTGRTYYIEYDMTGTPEGDLVNNIANDWHTLVDSLQLQNDGRYLHNGGLPVVGVFGFFPERFSPATANAILDIFQNGPAQYRAWVAGAGAWYWRTAAETTPAWQSMLYRLGAWQPWNCGNLMGSYPTQYAKFDYWASDKADFNAHGVIYQPELFPGASSNNRDGLPASNPDMPRQGGKFLWDQFVQAYNLGFQTVFLGMFDELDEGTQILKVTENWPTQGSFKAYEGQPSDCYLCYAGLGAKMLKGQIPFTATKPDCPGQTQPSIPDALSPLNGAVINGGTAAFSWTAAQALPGGGNLTRYEIWLDGNVTNVGLVLNANLALAPGNHVWRVRAVNSLGIAGGWSVGQSFSSSATPTPTRSPTAAPTGTLTATSTATRTPSPSATASRTASPSATRSGTPSITPTSSPSRTPSPAATFSATPSASPSLTRSATASSTHSPVATVTVTPTVSVSRSATQTNTQSPVATATATPTVSVSRSVTQSSTQSPMATATATPTVSVSRSVTQTSTQSPVATATDTPTLTVSKSGSPSLTPSLTPSTTASRTLSPAATASSSSTRTPSPLPSSTISVTPSATPTLSPSPMATASATPSPSPLPTVVPTLPSATPLPSGIPRVVQARPFPHPNPLYLSLLLEGAATQVRVRFFSPARVVVAELTASANGPAWMRVNLVPAALGPGLWHFVADTGPGDAAPVKGSLYMLR